MGKFDGMDPKLVRDLLSEVKHAATQMRTAEDRVRFELNRAGLSAQTTHRPVQIADAAEEMVRDVNKRLEVLEKRVDEPRGTGDAPRSGGGATDDDEPKDVRGEQDRYENPRAGEKPDEVTPKDDDVKTGEEPRTGSDGKTDADGKTGSDGKTDADGKTGSDGKTDADGRTGSDGETGSDGKTCDDADDTGIGKDTGTGKDTGVDADSRSDGGVGTGGDAGTGGDVGTGGDTGTDDIGTGGDVGTGGDPGTGGNIGEQPADQPKDDDLDSRRERGAEADGGGTDTGAAADTPAKDHPDDTDATKPQVVVVDGVKVLQIPLDPPTAEQIEDLLENTDKVQPAEMPKMPADATAASNVNAWANDGSDVVSADATPPNLDALKTVIENHRDIPPLDMPGVEVPAGEYGKGQWAEREIRPDGDPGSIAHGGPPTAMGDQVTLPPTSSASDGTGLTATSGAGGSGPSATGGGTTGAYPADGYGSVGITPIDDPSSASQADDACDSAAGTTPDGTGTTPDGKGTTPDGKGTTPDGKGTTPDGKDTTPGATGTRSGDADGTPGGTGTTPGGTGATPGDTPSDSDTGVRIPPTPPAGDAGANPGAAGDAPGAGTADEPRTTTPDMRPDAGGTTPSGAHGTTPDGIYSGGPDGVHGATPDGIYSGGPEGVHSGAPDGVHGGAVADAYGDRRAEADGAMSAGGYDVAAVAEAGGEAESRSGVEAWASDDSDVVSIDVPPPHLEALTTVIENHRDIQPQEMPSVQIPPGEYGKGEWAPEDIRPDGPPGAVDPSTPERSS
ncbi:hypothetical protein [Nonomuraea turcica]|uniref:hypothetical protein n=1 Tax=Nonomuraea sp. G32 TaxID=3067274 RepID=UPI00273C3BAF|nr:hypothetical protein [Nonomuraea sp. G32]MDP4504757.1 hypothetical protein [Nonomuraea sp. G32]